MKHTNSGSCEKCRSIIERYPRHSIHLFEWFMRLQNEYPDFHCSCFGRGQQDQEEFFIRKATKAHWTESAHNYNAAIDLFVIDESLKVRTADDLYPYQHFMEVLPRMLDNTLLWYGRPGAPFYELPHVEIFNWKDLVKSGELFLVSSPQR